MLRVAQWKQTGEGEKAKICQSSHNEERNINRQGYKEEHEGSPPPPPPTFQKHLQIEEGKKMKEKKSQS